MHRDIKPANILCNGINSLKLADFGLSKQFKVPLRRQSICVGTLQYMAPEMLAHRDDYSATVDMWAIGCIMYEMMTGDYFSNFQNSQQIITNLIKIFGTECVRESKIFNEEVHKQFFYTNHEGTGIEVRFVLIYINLD